MCISEVLTFNSLRHFTFLILILPKLIFKKIPPRMPIQTSDIPSAQQPHVASGQGVGVQFGHYRDSPSSMYFSTAGSP